MKQEEIQEHITQIIKNTFDVLLKVYDKQKEPKKGEKQESHENVGSRIIFPKYSEKHRNGKTRLSEQELRFIFVEQFNKHCKKEKLPWFYSVETPTEGAYSNFSKQGKPQENEDGRSGAIDLTIHNEKFERIALIEFKEGNKKEMDFTKDLLKLQVEPTKFEKEPLTFFVMYIEKSPKSTIENLHKKIYESEYEKQSTKYKSTNTVLHCYALDSKKDIKIQGE